MTRTTPRKARSKPARRSDCLQWALAEARAWAGSIQNEHDRAIFNAQCAKAESQLAALLEDSRRRP